MTVFAAYPWPTNARLIEDVARLYLQPTDYVLDPTWGRGTWWKRWSPDRLVKHDKYTLDGVDFRHLPHPDETFDVVAFDPPYKLNGTPQLGEFDNRYGVDRPVPWQVRHEHIRDGISECTRVLKKGGVLLLKCQDQVCSGAIRWQTREFADHGEGLGLHLEDRFDMLGGGRRQPSGRRQLHAHGRPSTLLVFKRCPL